MKERKIEIQPLKHEVGPLNTREPWIEASEADIEKAKMLIARMAERNAAHVHAGEPAEVLALELTHKIEHIYRHMIAAGEEAANSFFQIAHEATRHSIDFVGIDDPILLDIAQALYDVAEQKTREGDKVGAQEYFRFFYSFSSLRSVAMAEAMKKNARVGGAVLGGAHARDIHGLHPDLVLLTGDLDERESGEGSLVYAPQEMEGIRDDFKLEFFEELFARPESVEAEMERRKRLQGKLTASKVKALLGGKGR